MKGVIPESVVPGPSGHLELSEELLNRLVCTEPLEKYYEVEDEPFARYYFEIVYLLLNKYTKMTFYQFSMKFANVLNTGSLR